MIDAMVHLTRKRKTGLVLEKGQRQRGILMISFLKARKIIIQFHPTIAIVVHLFVPAIIAEQYFDFPAFQVLMQQRGMFYGTYSFILYSHCPLPKTHAEPQFIGLSCGVTEGLGIKILTITFCCH